MYFLLQKKYDEYPSILYSVKDKGKIIHMILKYLEDNDIRAIIPTQDFEPLTLGVGKYLVEENKNEYIEYEVIDTGIIRSYMEFSKINRLNVVNYEVREEVDDTDDVSATMKELLVRYGS